MSFSGPVGNKLLFSPQSFLIVHASGHQSHRFFSSHNIGYWSNEMGTKQEAHVGCLIITGKPTPQSRSHTKIPRVRMNGFANKGSLDLLNGYMHPTAVFV